MHTASRLRTLLLIALALPVQPLLASESAQAGTSTKATATAKEPGKDAVKAEKKNVSIFVNKENDNADADVKLKVNDETWKFKLPTLTDGEERIIAMEDGRTVKAKRTGKEVAVTAGGETVKLQTEGPGMRMRFHGAPAGAPLPAEIEAMKTSIVITGVSLSEAEQKKVREAIKQAGITKPVAFIQGGAHVMLHGSGPMEWHDSGDGKSVRTIIMTKSDESGEFETEIDEIHGPEEIVIEQKKVEKKVQDKK